MATKSEERLAYKDASIISATLRDIMYGRAEMTEEIANDLRERLEFIIGVTKGAN